MQASKLTTGIDLGSNKYYPSEVYRDSEASEDENAKAQSRRRRRVHILQAQDVLPERGTLPVNCQ